MSILIALAMLAMVGVASAVTMVDEVEIRGTVVEVDGTGNLGVAGSGGAYLPGYTWDPYNFAGFWYDLDDDVSSEMLRINSTLTGIDGRTIPTDQLIYVTTPQAQDYNYYQDTGEALGNISGNPVTNYAIEGWMAEERVAISTGGSTATNANKLAKLLVEFETSSDKKTMATEEAWDLGGGFTLTATQIDIDTNTVTLSLAKGGEVLNETTVYDGDGRCMYTEDLSEVNDVIVFFCYVDAVLKGTGGTNLTQVKYVYLIDNDIEKIDTSTTYGNMEVRTASTDRIELTNDGAIDLSPNTDVEIMKDMYFRVADNDTTRFYPYKVYTTPSDYDVRGTVLEANYAGNLRVAGSDGAYCSGYTWTPYTFAAFWYELDDDMSSEMLRINSSLTGTNTIPTDQLIYVTTPQAHDYKYYQDTGEALGNISGSPVTNYAIEGWMAEKYVAISTGGSTATNANKLAKLLVEFETGIDRKTMSTEEAWDLGGGFTLTATQIDLVNNVVTLSLAKDGEVLNETTIDTSPEGDRRYMYTEDLSGESDVVVFFCYVYAVFTGDPSLVQLRYVYLIDNDIEKIDTSTTYGNMEVRTASTDRIELTNDGAIDLSQNTDVEIMKDMYFKVADNDTARFYPYKVVTIEGAVSPPETIPAADVDGDGVPDVWDADNSTPPGYWVNSDGIGRRWGDMNGDGKLTSVDALMILQAVAGKIGL